MNMKININKQLILEVADDIANATGVDYDSEDGIDGKSALIGAGTALGLVGSATVYAKRNAIKNGAVNKYNAVKTKVNDAVTGVRQNVANKIYPEGPKNASTTQAKYEKDLSQIKNVNEKLKKDNKTATDALKKAKADAKTSQNTAVNTNANPGQKTAVNTNANPGQKTAANTNANPGQKPAANTNANPGQKTAATVMNNLRNKAQNRTTK
jgi:hypothetical protein